MSEPTIVKVRITQKGFEPAQVNAQMSDGSKVKVFSYYDDELYFSSAELIGLTVKEAIHLNRTKDIAYLRS